MKRVFVLEFTKMNGAGNDFIVIDNRFFYFSPDELASLAARFCARRTGIGADGLLALSNPETPSHHFRMQYFNADGSLATMCGNGARCLVRFAQLAGIGAATMQFETEVGVFEANVPTDPDQQIRVRMNPPKSWTPDFKLQNPLSELPTHYIWTGTEHVVQFVPDVLKWDVARHGRAIRYDPALAPLGANANFVTLHDEGVAILDVRTYERGVEAETLACGTGALAAAVSARLLGYVQEDIIEVNMPGGQLGVEIISEDGEIKSLFLEGPVETVYRGSVSL